MKKIPFFRSVCCLLSLLYINNAANAQTPVLEDQFNTFDQSKWTFYGQNTLAGGTGFQVNYGRTNFNREPFIVSESGLSFVRVQLDTDGPILPNGSKGLRGTEMYSRTGFGNGGVDPTSSGNTNFNVRQYIASSTGFEFESRIRFSQSTPGIVGAFWTYANHGTSTDPNTSNYSSHEIDIELLPKHSSNSYWLVNYRGFNNSGGTGYSNPSLYSANSSPTLGPSAFDWTQWHDLKIRWVPDPSSGTGWRTDWFAKRPSDLSYSLLRSDKQASPDKWMTVRFNAWAPDSTFGVAYSNGSPASTDSANNKSYYLDVDWVKVTAAPAPAPSPWVTQVNGVAVSNGQTFSALNSISGKVVNGNANPSSPVTQVNMIIVRQSDGAKWRGYGSSPGWETGSGGFGVATTYNSSTGDWTTSGTSGAVLPTSSQLINGGYTISADAYNGTYISSPQVKINIVAPAPTVTVTQINGVSNPNGQTFNFLNSISGNVTNGNANPSSPVTQVNMIIVRQSDNAKWRGYGSSPGWETGSGGFGVATTYNSSTGNWTTSGTAGATLPTSSQLSNGGYTISADAYNGTYISSPLVKINIAVSTFASAGKTSKFQKVSMARKRDLWLNPLG